MNQILIAVYGSLRKDQYNYRDNQTYLETIQVPGWKLYDLGAFPAATLGWEGDSRMPVDLLTVDLMTVPPSTLASLINMEHGAGYHTTVIPTSRGMALMWWMTTVSNQPGAKLVESGDWAKYLEARHAAK